MQTKKYSPPTETEKLAKSAQARSIAAKRFLFSRVTVTKTVKPGRFRMTAEQLSAVSKKGTELLLNATPEDMNTFRKWL